MGGTGRYREFVIAVVLVGGLAAAMSVTGAAGWPGDPSGCLVHDDCYCEAFRDRGAAVQPVNTLTNAGFVLVGLAVLAQVGRARNGSRAGRPNRMRDDELYPVLYGSAAIGLGVGSALFHGTMTDWGGWFDLVSMYAYISFLFAYNVGALRSWNRKSFAAGYGILVAVLALVQWPLEEGLGKFVFGALIIITVGTEWRIALDPFIARRRPWFWVGLGSYVGANLVWLASRTGAPLCDADSLLQGHGLWHLVTAGSVAAFYAYLRTERIEERALVER